MAGLFIQYNRSIWYYCYLILIKNEVITIGYLKEILTKLHYMGLLIMVIPCV